MSFHREKRVYGLQAILGPSTIVSLSSPEPQLFFTLSDQESELYDDVRTRMWKDTLMAES